MADLYELEGTVERVIFYNEGNHYAVIELETTDELIVSVGAFPYVSKGEELKIIGEWTTHSQFGRQLKSTAFERKKPTNTKAILKYLSGGSVKGVGLSTAKRIVELFGENSLDVIENDPKRLVQIKGITEKKALAISDEIKKIYGMRELMLYLSGFGVKPEEAIKAWKAYGSDAIHLINENPYCLCDERIALNFAIADSIALSMEKSHDNVGRVQAGVVHILRHNLLNGHSCLPAVKLLNTSVSMLQVESDLAQEAIVKLCETNNLICDIFDGTEYIFLPNIYQNEELIAQSLAMAIKYPARPIIGIDEEIRAIEKRSGIEYAELQKIAIKSALEKGILILTGGPGTGKTTTLKAIIDILKKNGDRVFLSAPTGRAAKRMSELTGEQAKTIHRMLQVEWDKDDNPIFLKNERNQLECDSIIIDEVSMVDINLMQGLLAAIPLGCRIVMVGDTDQLPSVGAGNVLSDLIGSELIPTVKLTEIFRQSRESLIVMNSHKIVAGEFPDITKKNNDFFFLPFSEPVSLIQTISDLIYSRLPNSYGYDSNEDIQILCTGRKGELGTENLNLIIRDRINPSSSDKKEVTIMNTLFREGDKLMHIKNNYNLPWVRDDGVYGEGVFNGDMGILLEIDKHSGTLKLRMDDKEVSYEFEQAGQELEHAYAVTVHKSQGNEFPAVILPLYRGTKRLKYRNLLYTAVTRAKEILIIAGEQSVISEMIADNTKTLRYTGLLYFMKRYE